MATIRLPSDFKEFLRLLNSSNVEYMLVGGYAVVYYGYPRATADLDVWVARNAANAERIIAVLNDFGFRGGLLSEEVLVKEKQILRMGVPPLRIEILTSVTGAEFEDCYQRRNQDVIDDVDVSILSLTDLKKNKAAAGRHKDIDDIEHLPPS